MSQGNFANGPRGGDVLDQIESTRSEFPGQVVHGSAAMLSDLKAQAHHFP
jgi:hypothetical protein